MFRLEMKRAFGIRFLIVVIIGIIITTADFISRSWLNIQNISMYEEINSFSVYYIWIMTKISTFNKVYLRILPILCAFAYGSSTCFDKRGYNIQLISRGGLKKYVYAKYICGFLAGGCSAIIPAVINLIMCMCFVPVSIPISSSFYYPIWEITFGSDIFYSDYHFMYAVMVIVMMFITYGGLALLCNVAVLWENNEYIVVMMPFIICYILNSVTLFNENFKMLSPMWYTNFFNVNKDNVWMLMAGWGVMAAVIAVSFVISVKEDIL